MTAANGPGVSDIEIVAGAPATAYAVVRCTRCGALMALEADAPAGGSTVASTCRCEPPRRFTVTFAITEVDGDAGTRKPAETPAPVTGNAERAGDAAEVFAEDDPEPDAEPAPEPGDRCECSDLRSEHEGENGTGKCWKCNSDPGIWASCQGFRLAWTAAKLRGEA